MYNKINKLFRKINSSIHSLDNVIKYIDRAYLALIHDSIVILLSIPISFLLRVGVDITKYPLPIIIKHSIIYSLISMSMIIWFQLYRDVWRYTSTNELIKIISVVTYSNFIYSFFILIMPKSESIIIPRSLIIINWFLNLCLLSGSRILYKIYADYRSSEEEIAKHSSKKNVLFIGLTNQTEMFIKDILRNKYSPYNVIGIIDDNKSRKGRYIHGIKVFGSFVELIDIIKKLNKRNIPPDLIITSDSNLNTFQAKILLKVNDQLNIKIFRLPKTSEIPQSLRKKFEIKPVSIEELLGRPTLNLDHKSMKELIKNQNVLITGAGGTIGSELSRQIANFNPSHITLLDYSEYLLYSINLKLKEKYHNIPISTALCNVSDKIRINKLIQEIKPNIVFHAAALKHVPIAEQNPNESILTNIIGTKTIGDACVSNNVQTMVLISTDKAVSPTSIMGATKRIAESYCQALNIKGKNIKNHTNFVTVRFGNVLGSTGSVVPLFQRQIANRGPVTITDPNITRYFMTVQEAVELVLQAAAVKQKLTIKGGQIFILDMGQSIKIVDLAKQMIKLAGFKPNIDIPIKFIGLRPGEKIHEKLFDKNEQLIPTGIKGLILATPKTIDYQILNNFINLLEKFAKEHQTKRSINLLKNIITEHKF